MMTSRDQTKWGINSATPVVSDNHKVKNFRRCMTSSEIKIWLWIFCPQMTLHDVPKMFQIGVKSLNLSVAKKITKKWLLQKLSPTSSFYRIHVVDCPVSSLHTIHVLSFGQFTFNFRLVIWPSSFILDCLLLVFWIDKYNQQRPYTLTIGRPWDASI